MCYKPKINLMRKHKCYFDTPYHTNSRDKTYQILAFSYFEIIDGPEGKKVLRVPRAIKFSDATADTPKSAEQLAWLNDFIRDRDLQIEKREGVLGGEYL